MNEFKIVKFSLKIKITTGHLANVNTKREAVKSLQCKLPYSDENMSHQYMNAFEGQLGKAAMMKPAYCTAQQGCDVSE